MALILSKRSVDFLRDVLGWEWREGDPPPMLPDGVYLGLPEELYFLQLALGSTDMADLWLKREGWWWKSPNNPWWRRGKTTPEMLFGSACHTLLLEGLEAFESRWAVSPDPRHFPDLLTTADEVFAALAAAGAPGAHPKLKKDALVDLARVHLQDRHVWDIIMDRFRRSARDRDVISAQERWELGVMLDAAMEDPAMRAVVTADGGVHLAEVSVFWTLPDGVRLRFRFDSLLPAINADLKTLGMAGNANADLADAVGKRIGTGALDVQAAMSFVARRALYDFVAAGQVKGGTEDQRAWLERFPGEAPLDLGDKPGWAWLWMFYQKADTDGRAPIIFPAWMHFGSLDHLDGHRKLLHALAFYREKVATVGLSKPWTRVEPVHFMDPKADKRVTIPHWVERPMQIAGDEEAMKWRSEA